MSVIEYILAAVCHDLEHINKAKEGLMVYWISRVETEDIQGVC